MNPHLQSILNFIQNEEHLSDEEKTALLKAAKAADKELEITSFKLDRTEKVKRTTAILLEETIEELEQKRKSVEAQNRELEIESALERVRTVAMSMRAPDDLLGICEILYAEFQLLGFNELRNAMINIYEDDKVYFLNYDYAPGPRKTVTHIPYNFHPLINKQVSETKNAGDAFIEFSFAGNELKDFRELRKNNGEQDDPKLDDCSSLHYYFYSFGTGSIGISTYNAVADEKKNVLKRFRNVFDLAYKRYVDIAKAEAQAREAQIEAALERVRGRTMAMQHSEELAEVATLLFQQVKVLGVPQLHCGFSIFEIDDKEFTWYPGSPDGNILSPSKIPLTEHPVFISFNESRKRGDELFVYEKGGEYQAGHYRYMHALPGVGEILQKMLDAGLSFPTFQIDHIANFSHGNLTFITSEHFPEMHDVFKRFAKVFEQTYTRFLDLQKAETQARESQIQLALERVRARTMAMQHSDELKEAAALLFQQAKALGIPAYSCGYNIWEKDDREFTSWMSTQDGSIINGVPNIPLTEDANFIRYVESKEKGESFFVLELRGGRMQEHYKYLKTIPAFKAYFDYAISVGFDLPETQIHHLANFSHGNLLFISLAPCPEFHDVFKRFAAVFDQTYTRFLDLQRAEAQAREATKQASLDRVRGQIASMRSIEDLERITPLIWHELTSLGVPFIRCGVLIIDEEKAEAYIYLSSPDGHSLAAMNLPLQSNTLTANSVEYWRKGLVYTEHWSQEDFIHWMQSMIEQGQVQNPETYQGAAKPPESLHLHFVPFTQGMLYVGNTGLLTDDEIDLVKSLAEAFSIAYARYEDFTKLEKAKQSIEVTLTELKATQTQLIQSEKMASLGELTAGIAHEIQNPLNFVNNFSEVNQELLAEMTEEINKGNFEEAKSLAKDVTDNEEKINHHGKRADAIVKGMLQHSRSSTGVKEPPDINALADEYLRLAYHGLRAKDKDFNAAMKTDFDNHIGKINIIPQDIGRVILNLITNAFYAVNEKHKACQAEPVEANYEPTVTVSTKQNDVTVEIAVADNGNGIPQKVLDKIFQPFFTTKPTGQGTGLGLSLSYDIIKAHGGSAILYGLKARQLSQQLNYIDGEIEVAPVLSEALSAKGNFSQALEIDFKALQIAEKNGKQNLFYEYWIGAVYYYSGDYAKALVYFLKYKSDSDKITRAFIGETYYHLSRLDSAFFYINKAYQLDKNDSTYHWSVPYYYMALIEAKRGKFKDALDNYRLGLLYSRNTNQDIADGYNGIAVVFKQMGQVDSAAYYAKNAMKLAQKESLTPKILDAAALLTELYIKVNTDSAFKYQRVMLAAKDSLFSEEKIKQLQNLSFNEQMRQQELQQTIQQTQLKYRNRLNVYILLAGLLILLIVALGLWRRNIYKQKSFALLHKQKQQIESTLTQLKATQSQLIQSEKMASLGELTAGIAHEIRNPLNFVNNFSEVNKELIDEMQQEMDKGNLVDAKAISNDIKENEQKINHHGKRADAIVKGMLQHSRSSTGVKEPSDINALADEYLRLSYHGLRAKDKNFNAEIKTDFDATIGKINVIPQDIGRVLLNLYNNAFYAVSEKKTLRQVQGDSYEPTVTITTKKSGNSLLITVSDNGNGIPQKIVDKIFQPFFTTKPTGQGTGLGLSLSYDIIKAHGGEIKVETKENEGSEFIISLPVNI